MTSPETISQFLARLRDQGITLHLHRGYSMRPPARLMLRFSTADGKTPNRKILRQIQRRQNEVIDHLLDGLSMEELARMLC